MQSRREPETRPSDDRDGSINRVGWTVASTGAIALGAAGFLFPRASSLNDQANADTHL